MDSETLAHLKEIYNFKLKRLRVLEVQQAKHGDDVPAHIATEISALKKELEEIELRTSLNNRIYDAQTFAIVKYRKLIEVELSGSYSPTVLAAIIRAIAAIVNISVDQVKLTQVLGVTEKYRMELPVGPENISVEIARLIQSLGGNIIYKFDLPASSADLFLALYIRQDENVMQMGVQSAQPSKRTQESDIDTTKYTGQYISSKMLWMIIATVVVLFILSCAILAFRIIA